MAKLPLTVCHCTFEDVAGGMQAVIISTEGDKQLFDFDLNPETGEVESYPREQIVVRLGMDILEERISEKHRRDETW